MGGILKLSLSALLAGGALITGVALGAPAVAGAGVVSPPGGAIVVGVSGPNCSSPSTSSIQTAINGASSGATIYVCAGTYNESLSINKPLTLLGAQYGVDARTRSGDPETVVDGTGGIDFTSGATTGEVSGLTINGYTGGVGAIQAANVGSAWTFTDDAIDVSEGGIYFNTDDVAGPGATTISDNEFTQAVGSEAGSGYAGQAVIIWQKAADNVTIHDNDFSNLSGPGANINTTGSSCATTSHGLTISDNTSEVNGADYDDNLVALFCTTDASITGNTFTVTDAGDVNAVSPIFLGGGNYTTLISGNTLSGNGAPYPGGAIGLGTAFYTDDQGATVSDNVVTGWGDSGAFDGQAVVVYGDTTGFNIEGNKFTDNSDGIWVTGNYGGTPSGTVSGNYVHASSDTDCVDDTTGSGTAGTNDTWTGNIGATSSPSGLCGIVSSSTSTSPATASLVLGSSNTDHVTVTGIAAGPNPSGTVQFYECGPTPTVAACTSVANPVGSPVSVVAGAGDTATATSHSFTPTGTGYTCFAGVYSGDSNYAGSSDTTTTECFNVSAAPTRTKSTLTDSVMTLGQRNTDTAKITGGVAAGGSPTGTVSFYECGLVTAPASCTSRAHRIGSPVTVSPGSGYSASATSSSFTPTAAGYWCYAAYYSGSSKYGASSDKTITECSLVHGPLLILTSSIPHGTKGHAYSATMSGRGGTAPYTWGHTGRLPYGIRLSTNGLFSGTPRASGTFHITVTVKDSSSPRQVVTKAFTLVIAA